MHESIFSGIYSHCYAIFVRQIDFKRSIRISFTEYAKPDFVSRTEIRFSGFRLTSLIGTGTRQKFSYLGSMIRSDAKCHIMRETTPKNYNKGKNGGGKDERKPKNDVIRLDDEEGGLQLDAMNVDIWHKSRPRKAESQKKKRVQINICVKCFKL